MICNAGVTIVERKRRREEKEEEEEVKACIVRMLSKK